MTMSGEELCAKLFEEHYAELVRYAARLVGDPHLAEDIVVEAASQTAPFRRCGLRCCPGSCPRPTRRS